jgi:DMSO/TMAO reductase YedYZ molybdopterin-dependent catalytic subunit
MTTHSLTRRGFLQGAAAVSMLAPHSLLRGEETKPSLIVREKEPQNLEFPFAQLKGFYTPNDLFYVRNHFPQPTIDMKTWRLKVVGAVVRPLELSYDEVTKFASVTVPVTLECAGNGRVFLDPKSKGVQWELGAVGTAKWTGAPLSAILESAQVKKGAVDVVLEGADRGNLTNDIRPSTLPQPFVRGMPLSKAMKPEVLLAHKMNGETLPAAHGYPLRGVVGGWYGMASVKWLSRIIVTDRPFLGYDQTIDYSIWEKHDGLSSMTPITGIDVKSSIARPTAGQELTAGKEHHITGAAWAGESIVTKVEISTDGGKTWSTARFLDVEPEPFCWRLWEYVWKPEAGKHILMARATDKSGRVQPMKRDPDRRNYMITHVQPVNVVVR